MNPDCDFVSLLGQAGNGKTLLALASALTQTLETKRYNEIIITRATGPVGDDIGFLPGTEEEKMLPWMGALEDNLEVLHLGSGSAEIASAQPGADWSKNSTMELIRSRIKVKSLNFMRGRTFMNKFLIIDEAQNLTPKQMKTLVTRAGPGTKIVCLGNIAQIDRSEEHTSELQSLMRISYAVFCLKKKQTKNKMTHTLINMTLQK